jgi:hypothetical protein
MGLLWRLLAPKPLKKARRTVRKATHPVSLLTPKPIKKARRAVSTVAHPWEAAEFAVENRIVHALKGSSKPKKASAYRGPSWIPARVTQQWIKSNGPKLSQPMAKELVRVLRQRNWSNDDLRQRVYPYLRR